MPRSDNGRRRKADDARDSSLELALSQIEIHFEERGFEHVPGGAVGLGEIGTVAVAASLGNAVAHATGWRPRSLPLRPDVVLKGLAS